MSGDFERDFDLSPQDEQFDPFSVVLFKALQAISALFFIALTAIAPLANKGKIDSKAEFLITMSWPDNHPDDFDMFVQDPIGNVVWYRRREAGFLVLERDNRGGVNDFAMIDGKKVRSPIRQEMVSLRGVVAGEFTVNVYHFTALTGKPVPVTVIVQKLNPSVQTVSNETIEMNQGGAEKTAIRFTLDGKGEVVGTTHNERSILKTFYNASRNGGPL
jgi:hypothetical protein